MIFFVKIKILGTILWQKTCFVVVEVYGFGAVCICRSMPTFQREMLSRSSGAEDLYNNTIIIAMTASNLITCFYCIIQLYHILTRTQHVLASKWPSAGVYVTSKTIGSHAIVS
jgi:hypothetical protein